MHFIAVLLISFTVYSQTETPKQENTEDLRKSTLLFSLEDVGSEKIYQLERTATLDHYLRLKKDDDEELRKIDSREAKKLDADFAARFIKLQYELPPSKEGCKAAYKLNMKGEAQSVCDKEDQKAQELAGVLKDLDRRFQ